MIELLNIDCMEYMAGLPDKHFQLAITDPPYGINATKMGLGKGGGVYRGGGKYKRGEWDSAAPDQEYFTELLRVSKNQIIWGANHFISQIPINSSCWIFWDKNNGESDFADGELAWTSFKSPVRKFKYTWSGFIQGRMGDRKETRIHPTQKPTVLYRWLLKNYAQPGDKILDTHLGSGSSAIACELMGFDMVGCELDPDYYAAARKRFSEQTMQQQLFK